MRIPVQDPIRQYYCYKNSIDSAVMAALESGRWLFGENVARFEQEFARYCDTSCLITVANGTDALEIALIAAEAKGREVITVANAGGYTTTACRVIGAIPVYVDIDPETLLISVPSALDAVTPQTVAVVVTHLYGRVADVSALRTGLAAAGREDVVIIEDCAQAHGAQINGKRAGSFGDLATFSFYPTKNLGGMGDGGAIACNKDSYCQIVKWIRQYGWQERYRSILPYGRNSRMDEVQAAILCVKLQYLDDWNRRRRDIVSQYKASSSSFNGWFNDSAGFVAHLAVARHPRRDHVRAQLALSEIMTDIHYPILDCDQQSQDGLLMVMHDLTESRRAISEIMTLPCFPEMSDIEVEQVCESLARLD